jgi:hypothetical protein
MDKCTLRVDDYDFTFVVRQFTIPLTADQTMSVGYNKKLKPRRRRRKRGKH